MGDFLTAIRRFADVYGGEAEVAVQSIELASGRHVSYSEYGDPDGFPILYCHGILSDHREAKLWEAAAESHGFRIVAPDRPGVGATDPIPDRRLLDWPTRVVQLVDALNVERFAVMGISGGGPYALACAYAIPKRVAAVTIVSGVAPLSTPTALREVDVVERVLIQLCRRFPRIMSGFIGGVADEYRVCGEPWGFDTADVAHDVDVWYGTRDWSLSAYHATTIATDLPHATLHTLPNTGHLESIATHNDAILATLESSIRSHSRS